jgi:hypothetical protein
MAKAKFGPIHRHWEQSVYLTCTLTQTQVFNGKPFLLFLVTLELISVQSLMFSDPTKRVSSLKLKVININLPKRFRTRSMLAG